MARWCTRCNRPLDREHHDVLVEESEGKSGIVAKREVREKLPYRRGRGRVPVRHSRRYGCKVRLVARVAGKVIVPTHTHRIKELQTAYVHESRFKGGTA